MKRLVVQIRDLDATARFPVDVFCERLGGANWKTTPVHQGSIGETLKADGWGADDMIAAFLTSQGRSADIDKAGAYLGALLDEAGAGKVIRDRKQASVDDDTRFRLILDIKPPILRRLPWELLRWGNDRCFIDVRNPAFRCTLAAIDEVPQPIAAPVRILVVVGAKNDDWRIKSEDEVLAINGALAALAARVDLHVMLQPSKAAVENALRDNKPHVLHFCGHGGTPPGGKPSLYLYQPGAQNSDPWSTAEIALALQAWTPRVVFLNACRTNVGKEQEQIENVGATFLDAGCAAVIGTNSEINDATAGIFARAVYVALANNYSVDRALAQARFDVQQSLGYDNREWATPALHLRAGPDAVLGLDDWQQIDFRPYREFASLGHLVDRHDPRRLLWRNVDAGPDRPPDIKPLVVVSGPEEAGKSWTTFWALNICVLRGYRVAYVTLDGVGGGRSFLDVLRLIRDGDPSSPSPLREPLDPKAFGDFNWALKYLGAGKKPPPRPVGADVVDDFDGTFEGGENAFGELFASYRKALENVAKERPLVLVIDQMKRLDEYDFRTALFPNLFAWIAANRLPNVRAVLVTSRSEYKAFGLAEHQSTLTLVEVEMFEPAARRGLYLEYFVNRGVEVPQARQIADFVAAQAPAGGWSPKKLPLAYDALLNL